MKKTHDQRALKDPADWKCSKRLKWKQTITTIQKLIQRPKATRAPSALRVKNVSIHLNDRAQLLPRAHRSRHITSGYVERVISPAQWIHALNMEEELDKNWNWFGEILGYHISSEVFVQTPIKYNSSTYLKRTLIERHLIYLGTLGEDGTRLVYWLLLLSEKDGAHKEKIHSVSDRHLLYLYPFHLSFSGRQQCTRKNDQLKETCDQWKRFTSASSVLRWEQHKC